MALATAGVAQAAVFPPAVALRVVGQARVRTRDRGRVACTVSQLGRTPGPGASRTSPWTGTTPMRSLRDAVLRSWVAAAQSRGRHPRAVLAVAEADEEAALVLALPVAVAVRTAVVVVVTDRFRIAAGQEERVATMSIEPLCKSHETATVARPREQRNRRKAQCGKRLALLGLGLGLGLRRTLAPRQAASLASTLRPTAACASRARRTR